jgi:hypothetical protein
VVYYGRKEQRGNEQTIQNLLDRLAKSQKQKHKDAELPSQKIQTQQKIKSKRNKKSSPNATKNPSQADSLKRNYKIKSNLTITYSV